MATADLYTATRTFDAISGPRVLSVKANSGSVLVECQHGSEWVTMKTYSADTVEVIDFGNSRTYRFSVTGAATYAL